jgi:PAS domain S-box-containing protein
MCVVLLCLVDAFAHADIEATIKSASEYDYPPFCIVSKDRKADGFSVELLRAALREVDLDVEFKVGKWAEIKKELKDGKVQVLPLVGRTPEREAIYDFTFTYLTLHGAIFVRKGDTRINMADDLADKEIIVMQGDNAEEYVKRERVSPHIISVETYDKAMKLLASGKHDAVIAQRLMGIQLLKNLGISEIVPVKHKLDKFRQDLSFAVREGDKELLALLNEGLSIVMADGTFERLYEKWFTPIMGHRLSLKSVLKYVLIIGVPLILLILLSFTFYLRAEVKRKTKVLHEEIEERKKAAEALLKSERGFKKLVENSPMAISVINKEDVIEYINAQHVNMVGYALEDIPTLEHWWSLAYRDEEIRKRTISEWQNMKDVIFLTEWEPIKVERQIFCKDGTIKDVELLITSVSDKILVVFHDITERKIAEEKIRNERDFSKTALDSLPGIFYLFDASGQFVRWNRNFENVSGYKSEEISRMTPLDFFIEPDRTLIRERIQEVFVKGFSDAEANFATKSGKLIPYYFSGSSIRVDGKPHLIGMGIDVSEQKQLQAQLLQAQKMEAIGHLAGGVAHDFNNILAAIMGHAQISLMKMKDNDPLRLNLEQILASAKRAANLTKSLLSFSRKQAIQIKSVNINNIVMGMTTILGRIIGEDLYLQVNTAINDLIVNADANQLEQVLMNLATNARDAMPDGGTLTVTTEELEIDKKYSQMHQAGEAGKYAVLSVTDTGIGMDETTKEHIFDPFFTTKEVDKGTGLGLAMIYGTIKQHKGFIDVYSAPEEGTTFKIYLPLLESGVNVSERNETPAIRSGNEMILLVEDDDAVRNSTKLLLKEFGYNVIEAIDGKQAVKLFIENKDNIHLVITDIIMPGQSGKDLRNELLKIASGTKVILVSGYSADILAKKGIMDSEVPFILKPFQPETLFNKIREVLDE